MDKQALVDPYVYPYNRILLSSKRNYLPIHLTTWMSLKGIVLGESRGLLTV